MLARRVLSAVAAGTRSLKTTALHPRHVGLKATMIDFEGWDMPVMYSEYGSVRSTNNCRSNACVFDVSHMGQIRVYGKDRAAFFERFVVGDIKILKPGRGRYSLITNPEGGVVDDTVITAYDDHIYAVINAGCADKDIRYMRSIEEAFDGDAKLVVEEELSLLALQGPTAAAVLGAMVTEDLTPMGFMTGRRMKLAGRFDCLVTRCGYTGEDGFEISVPTKDVVELFDELLSKPGVEPAGLAARDVLRLEAGLCLYGHDLDETITPVEAGLTFAINKRRKAEGGFAGADKILGQLANGTDIKRIGFEVVKGAPVREGSELFDRDGNKVGRVSSGTFSPTLGKPVGMGYVDTPFAANGTELYSVVRKKQVPVVVSPTPFVPAKYYKPPKK